MSGPLTVAFQRRATREIEQIEEWWRTNRPSAPTLFLDELERMVAAAALVPTLGAPARHARASGVRRLLLRQTRYHVYYRVQLNVLQVMAVWHAARGNEPNI
jgi:plasmid stabilization system protein ParE